MTKAVQYCVAVNLIGVLLFLYFNIGVAATIRAEHRTYADFGDALNLVMTAGPVILLCIVFNLIWGIRAILKRNGQNLAALLPVGIVWALAILGARMLQ